MQSSNTYHQYVRSLEQQFPSLRILLSLSNFPSLLDLVLVDVDSNGIVTQRVINQTNIRNSGDLRYHNYGGHRFIFVQDLSLSTIEILGQSFGIRPQFFADHLRNSDYSLDISDQLDQTTGLAHVFSSLDYANRNHFTLRWRRLVPRALDVEGRPQTRSTVTTNIIRSLQELNIFVGPHGVSDKFTREAENQCHTMAAVTEHISVMRFSDPAENSNVWIIICDPSPHRTNPKIMPPSFSTYFGGNRFSESSFVDPISYFNWTPGQVAPPFESETRSRILHLMAKEGPFNASKLFNVVFFLIQRDWNEVITQRRPFLQVINVQKSEDDLVRRNVSPWRMILGRWNRDLVENGNAINGSLLVLRTQNNLQGLLHNSDEMTSANLPEQGFMRLEVSVETMHRQVEDAAGSLIAALSIIESQKAISQAERVSKLTELAFLFIPISFVATLFGANINEFQNNLGLPLWGAITAGSIVFTYALRFGVHFIETRKKKKVESNKQFQMKLISGAEVSTPSPSSRQRQLLIYWLAGLSGLIVLGIAVGTAVPLSRIKNDDGAIYSSSSKTTYSSIRYSSPIGGYEPIITSAPGFKACSSMVSSISSCYSQVDLGVETRDHVNTDIFVACLCSDLYKSFDHLVFSCYSWALTTATDWARTIRTSAGRYCAVVWEPSTTFSSTFTELILKDLTTFPITTLIKVYETTDFVSSSRFITVITTTQVVVTKDRSTRSPTLSGTMSAPGTSLPSPTSPTAGASIPSKVSPFPIGIIAGTVVAGVLVIIATVCIFCILKRRKGRQAKASFDTALPNTPSQFLLPNPEMVPTDNHNEYGKVNLSAPYNCIADNPDVTENTIVGISTPLKYLKTGGDFMDEFYSSTSPFI